MNRKGLAQDGLVLQLVAPIFVVMEYLLQQPKVANFLFNKYHFFSLSSLGSFSLVNLLFRSFPLENISVALSSHGLHLGNFVNHCSGFVARIMLSKSCSNKLIEIKKLSLTSWYNYLHVLDRFL